MKLLVQLPGKVLSVVWNIAMETSEIRKGSFIFKIFKNTFNVKFFLYIYMDFKKISEFI